MARGWESKSVESQIESARSERPETAEKPAAPNDPDTLRKKETLRLARTRLLEQLRDCENPRYREMIKQALADLEKTLAQYH